MLQANYKKKCKGPLIVSIVLIIGVLAYCKYTNMLIDLWNQMRGLVGNKRIDTLKLIVPLGISYSLPEASFFLFPSDLAHQFGAASAHTVFL